jgi:GNAT superfamily N-acetyltransferase
MLSLVKLLEGNYLDFGMEREDVSFEVWNNGDRLELGLIYIPVELRKKGLAKKLMEKLINYADGKKLPIYLTPTNEYGSNLQRLVQFYKKFGFVKNLDKSKTKHLMVRMPM